MLRPTKPHYNWQQSDTDPNVYTLTNHPHWSIYNSSGTYYLRYNDEFITDSTNIWEAMASAEQYFPMTNGEAH